MRLYIIFLIFLIFLSSIILLVLPEKSSFESEYQGKVLLTSDGFGYFVSFIDDEVKIKEFFDNLTQELAKAIPVSPERITTNRRYEIETDTSCILSIDIERTNNKTERKSSLIVSDLDTLIKNKLTTVIGSGEYTNYLDAEYGYQIIPSWIKENWKNVIISIAVDVFFLSLAYWNNTFTIYSCANAIERLVVIIWYDSASTYLFFFLLLSFSPSSYFLMTSSFITNLMVAFKIVRDELMRHDLQKLLEELEDDLKEGNNLAEYKSEDGGTTGLIINNDGVNSQEKITKVLKEIKRELKIIIRELAVISDLMKELKNVNEKLNSKDIVKKLKRINSFIREFMQVEGSTKELLDVSGHLNKLNELLKEIKDNVNKKELNKINYLIKSMKNKLRIEQLKEKLNEAEYLIINNELASEDKRDLLKELNDFKKELRKFNDHAEPTAVYGDKEMNNAVEKYSGKKQIKKLKDYILRKFEKILRKFESWFGSLRESDHPEKKYRKISQWLRDYKDNQVIVVIFAILVGVDVIHFKLLGSMLRIPIPSLNFFCLKPKIIDVNFNAKLSHAVKVQLFWVAIINFFNDIAIIFTQNFSLSKVSLVVSLDYMSVYVLLKTIIHILTNLYNIFKLFQTRKKFI
ncbi:hypothetical protein GLOIN_2v1780441 [Rhizophagus irregularis DAOM 181602=DAOM 197198]|nr:hypothetical protein GLOIN_2v1780441 [Rhizophagus irregularis DAOM 181602=DAOM 197198]